jgi:cyclohexanone monooxygenase
MSTGLSVDIVGAGLARAGFRDSTIFDREDGVGGTWRINTHPGPACDVTSHLYSHSFDSKRCADEYGLRPHLRRRTEIRSARWEDDTQQWFKPTDFSFSGLPAEATSAVSPTAPARRSR